MDSRPAISTGSWASPEFARDYERGFGSEVAPIVGNRLLQIAQPRPDDVVLECACGTGAFTASLAQAVGIGGAVVACDLSQAMLAIAASKTLSASSAPVSYALMNMLSLGCKPATFDRAVSNLGMHIVPDRPQALAQFRSALRPGGLLAYTVPGDWSVEPFWTYFWQRVTEPDALAALTVPPRRWTAADRLTSLHTDIESWKLATETAGFESVDVHVEHDTVWFRSAERLLNVSAFGHVSRARGMLNDERVRDGVFADIHDRLRHSQSDQGVPMDMSVLCVSATAPQRR